MKNCVFCNNDRQRIVFETALFFVIRDKYPVTDLHSLIIPKRHVESYFDLNENEQSQVHEVLENEKNSIMEIDPSVTGFNIGINDGVDAGQTIMHLHIHLIPRRHGDMENPRGGVRGVIPSKQSY